MPTRQETRVGFVEVPVVEIDECIPVFTVFTTFLRKKWLRRTALLLIAANTRL
jgi:hypothetical protein